MLALVATQRPDTPVEIREVAEPSASPHEAIVEVHAFSLNRGELRLFATRPEGWQPGQDIAGVVIRQAADGSGPPEGSRVVALVDQAGWSQRVASPSNSLPGLALASLALLVSLIADGKLHPQIGSDKSWRELLQVMTDLRERDISGKAVFHID